jgi:hypothetical protein
MLEKEAEPDLAIAGDAGIGRPAAGVLVHEELHDFIAKDVLRIQDIEWDAQAIGNSPGICHLVRGTAAVETSVTGSAGFAPQAQHEPDHLKALLHQQGCGH